MGWSHSGLCSDDRSHVWVQCKVSKLLRIHRWSERYLIKKQCTSHCCRPDPYIAVCPAPYCSLHDPMEYTRFRHRNRNRRQQSAVLVILCVRREWVRECRRLGDELHNTAIRFPKCAVLCFGSCFDDNCFKRLTLPATRSANSE